MEKFIIDNMIIPRDLVTVKFHDGRPFLKIFYQYTNSSSDFFQPDDDFEFINTRNKFSIFKYINHEFKYNGYYEFLLEYPSVDGYNRWLQSVFPTETNDSSAIGYLETKSSCSWTGKYWGGLFKSSVPTYTYLEGSTDSEKFWFAIGSKKFFDQESYFPGPGVFGDDGIIVQQVNLYIFTPPHIYNQLFMPTFIYKFQIDFRTLIFILLIF